LCHIRRYSRGRPDVSDWDYTKLLWEHLGGSKNGHEIILGLTIRQMTRARRRRQLLDLDVMTLISGTRNAEVETWVGNALYICGSRGTAFYDGEADEFAIVRHFGLRYDRIDLEAVYPDKEYFWEIS
jgi:hypothetical protein